MLIKNPLDSVLVRQAPFVVMLFFANDYSDDSSAVYRFTGLGRLKENLAWFHRGIVTIGQDTHVQFRILNSGLGCLVV
jgi:hypothetical protein